MSVFDASKKPVHYHRVFVPGDIDSAAKTLDDIVFTYFRAMLLGSSDGSTYNTTAYIDIPMNVAGWSDLFIGISNAATQHNKDILMSVYATNGTAGGIVTYGELFQMTILAATSGLYFSIGTGGDIGLGGRGGGTNPTQFDYYSVPAIRMVPAIRIKLLAAEAPTTGSVATVIVDRR